MHYESLLKTAFTLRARSDKKCQPILISMYSRLDQQGAHLFDAAREVQAETVVMTEC